MKAFGSTISQELHSQSEAGQTDKRTIGQNRKTIWPHTIVCGALKIYLKTLTTEYSSDFQHELSLYTRKGALDLQPQVIKFTSCLPMVGGSLQVLRLPLPLKLITMI
jgi:hypothetical protein